MERNFRFEINGHKRKIFQNMFEDEKVNIEGMYKII